MRISLCCLVLLSGPVAAETHAFCWRGAEGYAVAGTISYPDGATGVLTEADLTGFVIVGSRHGEMIGRWSLEDARPGAPVTIRFDADALAFPMGGDVAAGTYQAWNAGGLVTDCGAPGFGFNGGNRAQDVCIDGVFVEESGVPPATPLAIAPDPEAPCGPLLLG